LPARRPRLAYGHAAPQNRRFVLANAPSALRKLADKSGGAARDGRDKVV
jgi:hypothetical protein